MESRNDDELLVSSMKVRSNAPVSQLKAVDRSHLPEDVAKNSRSAANLLVSPDIVVSTPNHTYHQKWCLMSFISPTRRVEEKFKYDLNQFLYHDVNRQIIDTTTHIVRDVNTDINNLLTEKISFYNSSVTGDDVENQVCRQVANILEHIRDKVKLDENTATQKSLRSYKIDREELADRFQTYQVDHDSELRKGFEEASGSKECFVYGWKCHGVFETEEEVVQRAKDARDFERVHVYRCPAGMWNVWSPNPDAISDQDYAIEELNTLMGEHNANERQKEAFFNKRKEQMIEDAKVNKSKALQDRLHSAIAEKGTTRKRVSKH